MKVSEQDVLYYERTQREMKCLEKSLKKWTKEEQEYVIPSKKRKDTFNQDNCISRSVR